MPILNTTVVRNGKAYDSGDVDVNCDGLEVFGVSKITYETSQEHQKNHSLQNKATSWSKGKITQTGSLELYMDEIVKFQHKGGGSLLNLKPFWTTVVFTNDDQEVVTDRILWKFQSDGREVDGSMGLKKSFEMFVLDIQLNK